jgi:hypothetical protein
MMRLRYAISAIPLLFLLPLSLGAQTTSGTIPFYSGTCTANGGQFSLIDSSADFIAVRIVQGAIVRNTTDGSEGVVTSVSTTTNPNDTLNIAKGMSGANTNDLGDTYTVIGEEWDASMNPIVITGDITIDDDATLTIGPGCDVRFQENSDDTHWGWDILRSEIIVYGELKIDGTTADPVTLTSTGVAPQGWFGIIFSDNTATGTIDYCNIGSSVYGINVTACSAATPPSISNCLINDVTTGFMFDNTVTPTVTDCMVIYASEAFSCWGVSAPVITNCNASNLTGDSRAVYATDVATPIFTGCAFSSGSVELDLSATVTLKDTTVSDAENGIIGIEYKKVVPPYDIPSSCRLDATNCNIIGLGDQGEGIKWDDTLSVCKVEYSRIGGFAINMAAVVGFYGSGGVQYGVCTGGDNTYLIDTNSNFYNRGAYVGMIVHNNTDVSYGTVVNIISIPASPSTFNTLQTSGMSGGSTNDPGDIYYFAGHPYNNIDLGDLGGHAAQRNWPPGYVPSVGQNEFYGIQDPGCLFNISLLIDWPYTFNVWAEGNWWETTNDIVIGHYIIDYWDYAFLHEVYFNPHRTPDEKRTYSVSGRILDENLGDPVEGVRVWTDISVQFPIPGHTVLADITDSEGYYTIYGLMPYATPYSIVAEKLFYTFSPVSPFTGSVTIDLTNPSDMTGKDFTASLPPPSITSAGRDPDKYSDTDPSKPPLHHHEPPDLGNRTNWGLRSETTDIIVTGMNFRKTPSVVLRPLVTGSDAACSDVVWVTFTKLAATVPAGMTAGDYSVVVKNPDSQEYIWGNASTPGFTIVAPPAPHVTGIGPNPISSTFLGVLTVSGQYFQSGCNLIIGGYTWPGLEPGGEGRSLAVNYDSGTLSAGTYAVIVTNPDEQSSNTDVTLTVNSPPPTITPLPTITPTPGPPTPTPGPPTPIPKYPRIQPITDAASYRRGETLALRVEMWPNTTNAFRNLGDLYIAVRTPNGTLLFLSKGRWKRSSGAIYKGLVIGVYSSLPLGSFKIGGSFPSATYTVYGVLNTSGTSVFNSKNWRSGLGSTSFTIQ